VRRNGRPTRNLSHTVAATDVVEVDVGTDAVALVGPVPQPLSILYEDEWLLVVDKPAGMLSQPIAGRSGDVSADQRLATQLAFRDGKRPFLCLVHRPTA
jgi:23S rRNA-/tRNA-specific pseudouridylate synthase